MLNNEKKDDVLFKYKHPVKLDNHKPLRYHDWRPFQVLTVFSIVVLGFTCLFFSNQPYIIYYIISSYLIIFFTILICLVTHYHKQKYAPVNRRIKLIGEYKDQPWMADYPWNKSGIIDNKHAGDLLYDQFPFFLGEKVNIEYIMKKNIETNKYIQVTLRCIQEKIVMVRSFLGSGDEEQIRCFEVFNKSKTFETSKNNTNIKNLYVSFNLPSSGVFNTRLSYNPPIYWELEIYIESEEESICDRFLIPVYLREFKHRKTKNTRRQPWYYTRWD